MLLWATLKKNLTIALGYFLTLTAALAALIIALKFIEHFQTYDDWVPGSEQVFRVKTTLTPPGSEPIPAVTTPQVFGAWVRSLGDSSVEAVTGFHRRPIHAIIDGRFVDETLTSIDPEFGSVFPIHDQATKLGPDEVLLSDAAAIRAFGTNDVVGRVYEIPNIGASSFTVAGVFRLPPATHLDLDVVIARGSETLQESRERDAWTSLDDYSYVRLGSDQSAKAFETLLNSSIDSYLGPQVTAGGTFQPHNIWKFEVEPVAAIPFSNDPGQIKPGVAQASVVIVGILAAFLAFVIIASFANYAVLLQSLQSRATALRRIFGESSGRFAWSTLRDYASTTLAIAAAGIGIALLLGPTLEKLWGLEPIWSGGGWSSWMVPISIALALMLGCAASTLLLAPKQRIEQLFEQSYSMSRRGLAIRTALFGFQLFGSALIICSTAMVGLVLLEHASRPAGIVVDDMRLIRDGGSAMHFQSSQETLRERAIQVKGVQNASFTNALPGQPFPEFRSLGRPDRPEIGSATVAFLSATPEFLDTVQGEMLAGRFFRRERTLDRYSTVTQDGNPDATVAAALAGRSAVILSESAARQMGFPSPARAVGESVSLPEEQREFEVIGVVPDWSYEGVMRPPQPFMVMWSEAHAQHMLVAADSSLDDSRLQADLDAVVDGISGKYELLAPIWGEQFSDLNRLIRVGLFISLTVFAALIFSLFAFSAFLSRSNAKLIMLSRLFGAGPLRQVIEPLRTSLGVCVVAIIVAVGLLVVSADPLARAVQANDSQVVRLTAIATGAALLAFVVIVMIVAGLRVAQRQQPIEVLAAP